MPARAFFKQLTVGWFEVESGKIERIYGNA